MEEKKFDFKSLIGFTLIFGILMWMMYSNQPSKEELAEKAKKEQAEKEAKTPKSQTSTVSTVKSTDSTATVSPETLAKLGAFAYAETLPSAKDANTLLKNNLLSLKISNKGGYISEATVLNQEQFKKGSGKAVQIIKDNNANLNLTLTTKDGKVINTKDLYFEPKFSKEGRNQVLTMQLKPLYSFLFLHNLYILL